MSRTTRTLHWLCFLVAGAVVVADQITKSIALHELARKSVHLLGPFSLSLTFNPGSSFSLLQGSTGPLMVMETVFMGLLAVLGLRSRHRWTQVALGLMLGGALGNFLDRLVRSHHGSVVDFFASSFWPTFNLADACITVGAAIMMVVLVVDLLRGGAKSDV